MKIVDLNGRWQFRESGEKDGDWLEAAVPGCVHTDLLANDKIPDPYYRDNELQVQWIGETDWEYRRALAVSAELLEHDQILLCCEGLDTLATLWFNGQQIGQTDNMFRSWEFDVRPYLKAGENEIRVRFDSALCFGQAKLTERYIHSWSTDDHKLPGGNYVRKAQCNFGWDWGPKLVTCGIWRDISLVAFDTARLADVHVRQDHSTAGKVTLTCHAQVERFGTGLLKAAWRVELAGQVIASETVDLFEDTAAAQINIADPQLWWPNGLGKQTLYDVSLTLLDAGERPLDTWQKAIGLRTLRLVREEDEWGESFQFACNDVPFFAKGANWIPADTFVTRIEDQQYEYLLSAAADAHMNMLRVWGGGIYEQTVFYELCDLLGICVWQDFMFSCATYPTFDDSYMANVAEEARHNIRRLRHHASLALWCGNNELEQGLVSENWGEYTMSWDDYGKLFDKLLPELVAELDPETDYWPGSPHTPHENRYVFNDPRWGDAHIWEVWHGMQPFEYYFQCFHRFNSEFGFQSFPEPRAVRRYTIPEDENITSYVMEHHQRNASGNSKIMHYLLDWFRLPTSFEMSLWLSQILQGMGVKYAVEHWRRTMPRGMGTLYWQLNDCWPVASWSSLDYDGNWKALHHMARHFYAPLMVSAVADKDEGTLAIAVTNDQLQDVAGKVSWEVTTVAGEHVDGGQISADFRAAANRSLATLNLQEILKRYGHRNLLIWLKLHIGERLVSQNLALFSRPKHLELLEPNIKWQLEPAGDDTIRITLAADYPALWVWLETEDETLSFSDNFFHLLPGQEQSIMLTVGADAGEKSLIMDKISVHSLFDTYQPHG